MIQQNSPWTLQLSTPRFGESATLLFRPYLRSLASNLSDTDTTLTVQSGEGDNFPSPSGGSILLTLENASGTKMEVVECSSRSGDSFTISRAADDTTAQSFSTGDKCRFAFPWRGPRKTAKK
jgi:hypothetical protein